MESEEKIVESKKEENCMCAFENCKYNKFCVCERKEEYEKCTHGSIFRMASEIYKKYPNDDDIWVLLQEIVSMAQKINKICDAFNL